MGTRSTNSIADESGRLLVTLYQQFDGYLSGVGADLKRAFGDAKIINGIPGDEPANSHNGMGCFAASVVAHFKTGIGGTYIVPATRQEPWHYALYPMNGRIRVRVELSNGVFDGYLSELPDSEPAE